MEIDTKISEINHENSLISIIVPAFNIENYLSDCLDSILSQTYENLEIVVVDDGSTDDTRKIADQYQQDYPNKIVCIHQQNSGVLKARLEGIKIAKGEWIGFVDGDDLIENDMYERLLNNALTYQTDISHCGYQTIVNQGERIHYFYNTGRTIEQDKINGTKDLLSGDFVEPGLWNKLYRHSLFDYVLQNPALYNKYRYNEDLLLNYLLFKESGKAIYEDFCPYHYMVRSESATRSSFNANKITDPLMIQKYILEDSEEGIKPEAYRRYLLTCINACSELHNKPEYRNYYEEALNTLKRYDHKSHILSRNNLLKLRLLLLSPRLYNRMYKIYEDFFQKKRYE